jgi:hypothetical protein
MSGYLLDDLKTLNQSTQECQCHKNDLSQKLLWKTEVTESMLQQNKKLILCTNVHTLKAANFSKFTANTENL